MYLSLDRPGVMYSAKELCRELDSPSKQRVATLKRLVRYLVNKPRLVWRFDYSSPQKYLDMMSDADFGGASGLADQHVAELPGWATTLLKFVRRRNPWWH